MSAYKFWRVSNIVSAGVVPQGAAKDVTCGRLAFVNTEGVAATPSSKASGHRIAAAEAWKAFTASTSTWARISLPTFSDPVAAYLQFEFPSPVTVTSVNYAPRTGLLYSSYEIWAKFLVEASTDGLTWVLIGQCTTDPTLFKTLQSCPIQPLPSKTGNQHRFWRVTDVVTRRSSPAVVNDWSLWQLTLHNKENLPSLNPSNGFAPNWKKSNTAPLEWNPANAFTGQTAFVPNGGSASDPRVPTSWWIGYDFKYPVEVSFVSVQMSLEDISNPSRFYWESAKLQYSDDKVNWFDQGFLLYKFPVTQSADELEKGRSFIFSTRDYNAHQRAYITHIVPTSRSNLLTAYKRGTGNITWNERFLRFSAVFTDDSLKTFPSARGRGRGTLTGTIYERIGDSSKKVPVARQVYLVHQRSGTSLGSVWSGEDGKYTFNGISASELYIIVSVDHTGVWGAEAGAFKRAQETPLHALFL